VLTAQYFLDNYPTLSNTHAALLADASETLQNPKLIVKALNTVEQTAQALARKHRRTNTAESGVADADAVDAQPTAEQDVDTALTHLEKKLGQGMFSQPTTLCDVIAVDDFQ